MRFGKKLRRQILPSAEKTLVKTDFTKEQPMTNTTHSRILAFAMLILASILLVSSESGASEVENNDLENRYSPGRLEVAGLETSWFTQLDLAVGGKIVDMQMVIDENDSTTYFSIEYGRQKEIISHKAIGPFGRPFGIEDAQEYAEIRRDIIQKTLDADGKKITAKVNRYTIPRSTIFAITDTGLVNAVDADSGNLNWSTYVGSYRQPTVGLGANGKYVAAVNGSYVYCLDAKDGKVMFQRKCEGIATASPAIGRPVKTDVKEEGEEGFILVPLRRGSIQMISIKKNGLSYQFERAVGNATARPLVTNNSVSWPTRRGHYNVILNPKPLATYQGGLDYRLKSFGEMEAAGKELNGNIYVTSLDGFVYSVKEETGVLNWDFSTGEGISQPAYPINDSVYVITNANELFRLDALTGINSPGWDKPLANIKEFVGKSKDRIYLIDILGRLVSLDLKSKRIISSTYLGDISFVYKNFLTDRLYFVFGNGRIQCLHELGAERPHFHSKDFGAPADVPKVEKKPVAKPKFTDEDDPFKKFDSDNEKKKADDGDPFSDDPFKSDNSKKSGADDDPFK